MTRFPSLAAAFIAVAVSAPTATAVFAQSPAANPAAPLAADDNQWAEFRLSDEPSPSLSSPHSPSARSAAKNAMRLRQQRAAYQQSQRLARIEADAWFGHAALRPAWSSVPMMSSRFPERRTIVIPVYVP